MAITGSSLVGKGIWLDGATTSMNVTALFVPGQLGQVFTRAGVTYQIVQAKSTTTTLAAGTPVGWTDQDDFVVSAKQTDLTRNLPAGITLGTITASSYGFIQVAGPTISPVLVAGAATDPLIGAGAALILGSSTDGVAISTAAGTAPVATPLAISSTASTGNGSVAAFIVAPHNGW